MSQHATSPAVGQKSSGSPATWKRSLLFGWIVTVVNHAAAVREPWRPQAWVTGLVGLLGAVWGFVVGAHPRQIVLGAVGCMIIFAVGFFVLSIIVEAIACRRAERVWVERFATGQACAMVRRARTGEWLLMSMSARPLGRGAGDQLLHRVCAEADLAGETIILSLSTGHVGRWYGRHGFHKTGRAFFGNTMARLPGAGMECARMVPEHNPDV